MNQINYAIPELGCAVKGMQPSEIDFDIEIETSSVDILNQSIEL